MNANPPTSTVDHLGHTSAATNAKSSDLVIKGVTLEGQQFRPSDWADRLCGVMSAFEPEERAQYEPFVTNSLKDGIRCVVVGHELAMLEPRLFRFFLSFAVDNDLQVSYAADGAASMLPWMARRMSQEVQVSAAPTKDESY